MFLETVLYHCQNTGGGGNHDQFYCNNFREEVKNFFFNFIARLHRDWYLTPFFHSKRFTNRQNWQDFTNIRYIPLPYIYYNKLHFDISSDFAHTFRASIVLSTFCNFISFHYGFHSKHCRFFFTYSVLFKKTFTVNPVEKCRFKNCPSCLKKKNVVVHIYFIALPYIGTLGFCTFAKGEKKILFG